jgi:hypothetical protein
MASVFLGVVVHPSNDAARPAEVTKERCELAGASTAGWSRDCMGVM